jgi:hypothetical protein
MWTVEHGGHEPRNRNGTQNIKTRIFAPLRSSSSSSSSSFATAKQRPPTPPHQTPPRLPTAFPQGRPARAPSRRSRLAGICLCLPTPDFFPARVRFCATHQREGIYWPWGSRTLCPTSSAAEG